MAKIKGESSFDSNSQKVVKFVNTPLPIKVYEGKLMPGAAIEKAAGKGKLPYIQGKVEALNSSAKKGGKNRTITHRFFLNTTPNANGNAHVNMGDQIVAYCKATNNRLKCPVIPMTKIDDKGNQSNVQVLDPDKLLQFLEGTAGTVFSFKSKNEPDQKDKTVLWPKVDHFIEAEEESEEEDEDNEDGEEEDDDEDDADEDDSDEDESEDDEDEGDDDEDEAEEDDEDEDEDTDEDEEEPAPKKGKKAGKPVAKKKGKK